MAKPAGQIRSVLIPITGERVLLPNATVAEVITFANPEAKDDAPDWFMGHVVWRGWRIPVFSLSVLSGWTEHESEAGAKIAVLKATGGQKELPFMAMVTQGFPRLVTIGAEALVEVPGFEDDADSMSKEGEDEDFEVTMESADLDPEAAGDEDSGAQSDAGKSRPLSAVVEVNGERAVIPDLTAIEARLLEVA